MVRPRPATDAQQAARISLWWYLAALVAIALLGSASLMGWLPVYGLMIALFLFVFWLLSFAVIVVLKFSAVRRAREAGRKS